MLTDQEQTKIESIFIQIEPKILRSIQLYKESEIFRQGIIVGLPSNKRGFYDTLYINIEKITPWQLKTFDRRVKKDIPGMAFIEQYDTITRLGFRK
ncbi:hypothetical protein [Flavobacterium laiguense]|uniref:Uncharacterized protein n=1 Tax=Flavobacterium laiguense TaxID=2169409 RepID=A0A2U1K186_9FLAO|nr:hypothetical protein [Flavobacterium laiguense]PWA10954.1 hypothetical protein DB891_03745 [Flavobacterium laiguense]